MERRFLSLIGATALVVLSACGGGGGEQAEVVTATPPTVPPPFGGGGLLPVTEAEEEQILSTPGGPPALPGYLLPGDPYARREPITAWFPGEPDFTPPQTGMDQFGKKGLGASPGPGILAPNVNNNGGQVVTQVTLGPNAIGGGPGQQPVPEPETVVLFTLGAAFVVFTLWRRGLLTRGRTAHARI